MACLKTHELQTERERRRERRSVHSEKVSLCAVPCCSPNHIRANESIPPSVMAAPTRGPRKEAGEEGRRVAGGLRYEVRGEENDRIENGRWWKGVACWVALMVSEGYRKREQKKHMVARERKAAVI